jgi:hypothetical protein
MGLSGRLHVMVNPVEGRERRRDVQVIPWIGYVPRYTIVKISLFYLHQHNHLASHVVTGVRQNFGRERTIKKPYSI